MYELKHLYDVFEKGVESARESYKIKSSQKDTRTMRASSLNNALKQIEKQVRDNGTVG